MVKYRWGFGPKHVFQVVWSMEVAKKICTTYPCKMEVLEQEEKRNPPGMVEMKRVRRGMLHLSIGECHGFILLLLYLKKRFFNVIDPTHKIVEVCSSSITLKTKKTKCTNELSPSFFSSFDMSNLFNLE